VKRSASPPRPKLTFGEALEEVGVVLRGNARPEIVEVALTAGDCDAALTHLRKGMRSHAFPTASGTINLRRMVDTLDTHTQREGMHVLQGWDFVAHRFPKEIAPILLLDYCARLGISGARARAALAILLDQYFLALVSLLAIRAWDEGNPNDNLDRVTAALHELQGPRGSGHEFVTDAETLLMLSVSYYHPEEQGYDLLVQRVSMLDAAHQLRFARACAALLGGHLRWGLRFMYGRDVGRMRDDNVADYPLLMFAVLTLARAHAAPRQSQTLAEREVIIDALLSGVSADPWAFVGSVPPALKGHAEWHAEFRQFLERDRSAILAEFDRCQPTSKAFSPLAFSCNFPTNATVAIATLSVQGADGGNHPPLNALFAREADSVSEGRSALRLAQRLMDFATSDPARLGAGGAPLIVYDPFDGVHCYNTVLRTFRTGP
jgi:hypothetical protein